MSVWLCGLDGRSTGRVGGAHTLKDRLSFYHSSSELHDDLEELVSNCKTAHVSVDTRQSGGVGVDVVTIKSDSSSGTKQKAMFVFGEHARELVTTESAVHFARSLCGLGSIPAQQARAALARTDFILVPNANPLGRQAVENGAFCKRTNENSVDLNRNWGDDHRETTAMSLAGVGSSEEDVDDSTEDEENPGPKGFSEPETQILHSLAEEVSPHLFLSVHSGTFLLGMPFGFSDSEQPANAGDMMSMLSEINEKYCGGCCPTGSLSSIGYNSKGCSIDFVTEHLKVPYAFTWEIYADSKDSSLVSRMVARKAEDVEHAFSSSKNASSAPKEKDFASISEEFLKNAGDSLLQADAAGSGDEACLAQFNPRDEDTLNEILDAWSAAYLSLADRTSGVQQSVMSNGAVARYCQQNHEMRTKSDAEITVVHTKPHRSSSDSAQDTDKQFEAPAHAAESMDEYFAHARAREKKMEAQAEAAVHLPAANNDAGQQDESDDEKEAEAGVPRWDALHEDKSWGFLKKNPNQDDVPDVDASKDVPDVPYP